MKRLALCTALSIVILGAAIAGPSPTSKSKLRLADATADACIARCTNENASCKRVCPTTFGVPCLNACDTQMQTCQQACQGR